MNLLITEVEAREIESIRRDGWDLDKDAHLAAMVQGLLSLGHRFSLVRCGDDWQAAWTCKESPESKFFTLQLWGLRLPTIRRAFVDATKRVWNQGREFLNGSQVHGDPPPNPRLPSTEIVHRFDSPPINGIALLTA